MTTRPTTRRRGRTVGIAAIGAIAVLLSACGSGDSSQQNAAGERPAPASDTSIPTENPATGTAVTGGSAAAAEAQPDAGPDSVLRYVAVGAPASAINDPHGGVLNQSDLVRFSLVYDVLTAPGDDGRTEYRLATEMVPDDSGTEWTVTLRDDATFTNGRPVTAEDVLFSLRRILAKKAENFGRLTMFDLEASAVADATTLRLVTTAPYYEVPRALEAISFVVPAGTTDFSEAPVGSGPYRLVSNSPDVAALERNDDWWGRRPPHQRIEVRAMIDPQARAQAVLSGQADVAQAVNHAVVRQIDGNDTVQVVRHQGVQGYPFVMRTGTPPFDKPEVRRAFKLAADRNALVTAAFGGLGTPSADILAPYEPGAPEVAVTDPDVAEAKRLLAEAGHPDGLDVELFTTTSYPGMQEAATVFAGQLAEIGVRAKVTVSPPDTYWTSVYNTAPFYTGFFGGIPFLDMARVSLLSDAPSNESQWHNPEWDKAFTEALGTQDDAERQQSLAALQEQIAQDGGYLVWGHGDIVDLASASVTGLPDGPGFAGSFIDQVGSAG